jgi:hypothetical protein
MINLLTNHPKMPFIGKVQGIRDQGIRDHREQD